MKRNTLAALLRGIEVFIALIALVFFAILMPDIIRTMGRSYPEYAYLVRPMIGVIACGAIPVCIAFVAVWKLCGNIAGEKSFTKSSVRQLTIIGLCALFDSVYCFVAAAVLSILGASNGGVWIVAFGVVAIGLAISVAAFLIARLTDKACDLENDSKYTI